MYEMSREWLRRESLRWPLQVFGAFLWLHNGQLVHRMAVPACSMTMYRIPTTGAPCDMPAIGWLGHARVELGFIHDRGCNLRERKPDGRAVKGGILVRLVWP